MNWRLTAIAVGLSLALSSARAGFADDASRGFAKIKPSLVKIWSIDARGKPTDSGSGFIVASDSYASIVLTSLHVVVRASKLSVDVNRDIHDVPATLLNSNRGWDIALLKIQHGGLPAVQFATEQRSLTVGNIFAIAGFFQIDDQIGFGGQDSHLLYPSTISSLGREQRLAELANVEIEKGLSGSPVFDPSSGDVVGMVESSHSSEPGGYAVTNTVLLTFLATQRPAIAVAHAQLAARPPLPNVPTIRPQPQRTFAPAEPARTSGGAFTPQAILANPRFYDGKEARVSGTIRNVVRRQSASGNDYVTLDLCDASCIHVFAFGTPNLTLGRQIIVRGKFSAVKHTGAYTFYNELEADDDAF